MNGTMRKNKLGHLEIGGCDVVDLVEQYGTPLYIFDEEAVRERAKQYVDSLKAIPQSEVIYAGKAFLTIGMAKLLDQLGLSLDVVSGGELYTALQADFPPQKIYFHGNNKSLAELEMALDARVGRIVVDNLYELHLLHDLAKNRQQIVDILFRITPGVEAHTHSYIQTGQLDSKFGIGIQDGQALRAIKEAHQLPWVTVQGVHCHIGSQIFDISSFAVAIDLVMDFWVQLANEGIHLPELDLGGGLGIRYTETDSPVPISEFGELVTNKLISAAHDRGVALPKLMIEPGRSLVGEAGTTIYTVGSIKQIPGIRTYLAVDGGMADNPRVALYQAEYQAIAANKANSPLDQTYTVAGKCCESGDMLLFDASLPVLVAGDLLAVLSTGAYNFSMASNYNMLPRPGVVNVYRGKSELLVERQSYQDLLRGQHIPDRWTKKSQVSKVAG